MFISRALLVLIALACLSTIECVKISSCSGSFRYGKLNSIQISDCGANDVVCPFKAGKKVAMELSYEAGEF